MGATPTNNLVTIHGLKLEFLAGHQHSHLSLNIIAVGRVSGAVPDVRVPSHSASSEASVPA
jgi:hypothetical protein